MVGTSTIFFLAWRHKWDAADGEWTIFNADSSSLQFLLYFRGFAQDHEREEDEEKGISRTHHKCNRSFRTVADVNFSKNPP